jgi:hypothetical protein
VDNALYQGRGPFQNNKNNIKYCTKYFLGIRDSREELHSSRHLQPPYGVGSVILRQVGSNSRGRDEQERKYNAGLVRLFTIVNVCMYCTRGRPVSQPVRHSVMSAQNMIVPSYLRLSAMYSTLQYFYFFCGFFYSTGPYVGSSSYTLYVVLYTVSWNFAWNQLILGI